MDLCGPVHTALFSGQERMCFAPFFALRSQYSAPKMEINEKADKNRAKHNQR